MNPEVSFIFNSLMRSQNRLAAHKQQLSDLRSAPNRTTDPRLGMVPRPASGYQDGRSGHRWYQYEMMIWYKKQYQRMNFTVVPQNNADNVSKNDTDNSIIWSKELLCYYMYTTFGWWQRGVCWDCRYYIVSIQWRRIVGRSGLIFSHAMNRRWTRAKWRIWQRDNWR